jgi:hypothetical protein
MKKDGLKKIVSSSVMTQQINLHFNKSDLIMNATPFGIAITMKGFRCDGEPGAPALPHKTIRVALSKGHTFKKLTIKTGTVTIVNQTPQPVVAIQQPSIGPEMELPHKNFLRSPVIPQKDLYRTAFDLGNKVCRFMGEEITGAVPVAYIELWPLRFTKDGLLEFVEEVMLTIESTPSKIVAQKEKDAHSYLNPKKLLRQHSILNDNVINPSVVELELRKNNLTLKKAIAASQIKTKKVTSGKIPIECDYLIITDDNKWDGELALQGSYIGNITNSFQKLADWKKSRGLRTHIAQVKEIVDGNYGDFLTGSRDLPEVIRKFLKWFCGSRGVEFVLLGGDVSIIPARKAASCAFGQIGAGDFKDKNVSKWKSTFLGMRVDTNDFGKTTDILTNYTTGKKIPYDAAGTSNSSIPGWYHTTSDTFTTFSATPTEWIRVNGPAAQINSKMVWYTNMNLIPTDFYYASLYGEGYSIAGKHDWDHLDNHLYGQHNATTNFDKVEFHTDVSVGRASVETVAEANAFVSKVLEYEKWGSTPRPDADYDRFRSMLFAASTWGAYKRIEHDSTNSIPPANMKYTSSGEYAILHCDTLPPDVGSELICFFDDHYYKRLNYRSNAKHGNPGWYYAKTATDHAPSILKIDFWPGFYFETPIPTPWIIVWDGNTDVLHPMYFAIDFAGLDSSITQQESLREKIQQTFPGITNIERLYTDEADMLPAEIAETWLRHLTEDNLRAALNRGPHFVSLTGHGNSDGCAFFKIPMVNSLTNGSNTFIAFADSCLTAQMDVNDSVAEVITNKANGGAVAYIGNTRFSWIGVGDSYRELFFMRLQSTRHLGLLNDSRLELLAGKTGWSKEAAIWYCFNTHVFGDPEMSVYRNIEEAKNYFIGNTNTGELHDCRCQWVDKMTWNHKIQFETIKDGLNAGYDGCGFCLKKYNKK